MYRGRGGLSFVGCDFIADSVCVCVGGVYGVRAGEFVSHDWKRGDSFV